MDILFLNPVVYTTAGIYAIWVWLCVTAVFILARLLHDNSIMDIFYGPIFAISYWGTWYLTGTSTGVPVLIGALVTLWALRLGIRIGRKNWGRPEDPRYATWRSAWCKRGQLYFILRSYLQINLLQGVIIALVATPLWVIIAYGNLPLSYLLVAGVALMVSGLLFETIADWQLDRFIARKKAGQTDAALMTTGLFAYSRRPNYFGESLVWWGFAIAAVSGGLAGWFVFISPLLITYVVVFITGPMLEAYFAEQYPEAYRAYAAQTNYFIPGRPRQ